MKSLWVQTGFNLKCKGVDLSVDIDPLYEIYPNIVKVEHLGVDITHLLASEVFDDLERQIEAFVEGENNDYQ